MNQGNVDSQKVRHGNQGSTPTHTPVPPKPNPAVEPLPASFSFLSPTGARTEIVDVDLRLVSLFPDTPTTQGLPLWCFNIVGGEIFTFPDTPTTKGLPLWCYQHDIVVFQHRARCTVFLSFFCYELGIFNQKCYRWRLFRYLCCFD